MADRQSVYTDFKDPFHLLNELRNIGLERVYKNAFAYGNREDMNMGYSAQPNSAVGRYATPNYNLQANAPTSTWTARQGSGQTLPPAVQMNYSRDYGDSTVRGGELRRLEKTIQGLGDSWNGYRKNIGKIRKESREKTEAEATARAEEERVSQYAPQMERLSQLEEEMADVEAQKEAVSNRIAMTKGIQEFRNTQRQAQAQEVQAQNREGFFTASPNVPTTAKGEYPKGHPIGMLAEPDQGNIGKQMANIFADTPPTSPSPGVSSMSFDVPKSRIPPGETTPFPRFDKSRNTASLSAPATPTPNVPGYKPTRELQGYESSVGLGQGTRGTVLRNIPPPPSGFNPSQSTPPGPKSMHRRRPR